MVLGDVSVQLHAGVQGTNKNLDASVESSAKELQQLAISQHGEFSTPGRHWHESAADAIDLPGHWEVIEVKSHCPFSQVRIAWG
jgi:hypothetical protein